MYDGVWLRYAIKKSFTALRVIKLINFSIFVHAIMFVEIAKILKIVFISYESERKTTCSILSHHLKWPSSARMYLLPPTCICLISMEWPTYNSLALYEEYIAKYTQIISEHYTLSLPIKYAEIFCVKKLGKFSTCIFILREHHIILTVRITVFREVFLFLFCPLSTKKIRDFQCVKC